MSTQPTPTDRDDMEARQARLEELYFADGRDDPKHKMHNLYTGLWIDNQPTSEEQSNER